MLAAPVYYWRSLPAGQPVTANLLTLFCRACGAGDKVGQDIPLVAVLRDTLGEDDVSSHKITAVWLLAYTRPTLGQRALASIPFFYWSPGDGSSQVKRKDTAPLLDLSAPQSTSVNKVERQILQWTALDTIGTPVRATTRAYRTNQVDDERLHLEEANTYLLNAPVGNSADEITSDQRDFVMARIELRKKLLGGFVNSSHLASLGKEASFEQESVRARNWELLRQCAEKAGLVFEPVTLAGAEQQYGMLWYPSRAQQEPGSGKLGEIWKLLSITNPYSDERLRSWTGFAKIAEVNGVTSKLIPLALYSFTYPRQPLLLVDFRDKLNLRRNDIAQKSIDEIASGIVGVSHFTNWYYFVATDIFSFVQERRGKTSNRAERLDSYSEFRVSLALDHDLDPGLRQEISRRAEYISSNPLESSPANEMAAALKRYARLSLEARGDNSLLMRQIDNQRREELAAFDASSERRGIDIALHAITLGKYTHRAKKNDADLVMLATYRRAEYNLEFLDKLVTAGTPPEVAFQEFRIRDSVTELGDMIADIQSPQMRLHAQQTLDKLRRLTADNEVKADCLQASGKLNATRWPVATKVPGVLAEPASTPLTERLK